MSLTLFFYLVDVLSSFQVFLGIAAGFLIFGLFMYTMATTTGGDELEPKIYWIGGTLIVVFILISCLIPEKRTMYLMLGSEAVTEIAKNERVQTLAGNSLELIENKVNELLLKEEPKRKEKESPGE